MIIYILNLYISAIASLTLCVLTTYSFYHDILEAAVAANIYFSFRADLLSVYHLVPLLTIYRKCIIHCMYLAMKQSNGYLHVS